MSIAEFDDIWKAILGDPLLAALRRKCSLADIRGVVMHASAPFARQVGDLTASLTRETARADAAAAEAKALREALKEVVSTFDDLISESGGVYGLHLNGDPAPWESLMAGGRFEEWTSGLEVARATLAQPADTTLSESVSERSSRGGK